MRFLDEAVETFERAEDRIDPTVIGDIVTEVMHGRRIDRRDPNRIDTQPYQIIEPLPDTIEIADAITVRVLKGPRVDLIDCPGLPPLKHDPPRNESKAGYLSGRSSLEEKSQCRWSIILAGRSPQPTDRWFCARLPRIY